MKSIHFLLLVMIFVVFLSLPIVAADENIDDENSTDLSVTVEAGDYDCKTLPWTVTAKANGTVARNVKVNVELSDSLTYISHATSKGEYNHKKGVWSIGDLESSGKASLIIITKLKNSEVWYVAANATTDTFDVNPNNNYHKFTANIIKPADGSSSSTSNDDFGWTDNDSPETTPESSNKRYYPDLGENNMGSYMLRQFESDALAKNTRLFSKTVSDTADYLNDTANSPKFRAARHLIIPFDYTRFPISILLVFMVVFVALSGYGRVKS